MGNILDKAGLKTYTTKVKTAIANAVAEVKLYLTTQKVTWSELKALRDAKKLVAGKTYRITDFVTTTAQADTRSAGHAFDLLVVADDEGTLNENARAVLHSGDTYFAQSDLRAWRLMYCLDNDDTRFAWADTANGKGVVWWMRDEWNNECFYDFKNIQYKLYAASGQGWEDYLAGIEVGASEINPYKITPNMELKRGKYTWEKSDTDFIWAYTWSSYGDDKTTGDKSLKMDGTKDTYDDIVHDCEIGANWETLQKDDEAVYSRLSLNFYIAIPFYLDTKDESFRTYGVKLGDNCHDIVTGRKCHSWTCGNGCNSWTCGNGCYSWTCGNDCSFWTCGNYVNDVNIPQDNVSYFHLASGTSYVNIRSNGTPTGSTPLQNFEVKGGIAGDSDSSRVDIVIPTTDFPLGAQYTWTIAKNSKGEIKQYCEADLLN